MTTHRLTEAFCVDKTVPLCYLENSPSNMDFGGYELALDSGLIHNLFIVVIASPLKQEDIIYIFPQLLWTKALSPPHYPGALIQGYNHTTQSDLLPWHTLQKVPSSENRLKKGNFHHPVHNKNI